MRNALFVCKHRTRYKLITLLLIQFLFLSTLQSQTIKQAELLIEKADSAIDVGELAMAEKLIVEALDITRKLKEEDHEAKYLVNLISVKIEQENAINIDEWYNRGLAIVTPKKDKTLLANLWNIKGRQLAYNHKFKEARELYNKVGEVYIPLGNDAVVAYFYNDYGYLEEAENNYLEAANWYLKAIKIFETVGEKKGLANTLGNLAITYFNLNELPKAIDFAQQSVAIRKQTGDKEGIAIVLGNITRMYLNMGNMDSVKHYQEQYIYYAKQSGKKKTLTDSYVNVAMIHHAGKNFEDAFTQMKNAIQIAKEINHPNLPNFYRMNGLFLGKMDRKTEMNNYYDSAYTLIVASNNKMQFRDFYATRMNYFKSQGDYKNAFENYEKYISYRDSLLNEDVKKQVALLEVQYETEKKNAQIESNKLESAQQQLYYNIAISVLILGLLLALLLFNRYSYRKKLEQKNILLAERNRISSELHDEVGSSLSAINLMSHAAMHTKTDGNQQAHDYFSSINNNSAKVMETISDIVWSMHPENDQMPRIIARMKTFCAEILEAVDTRFTMNVDEKVLSLTLSSEKRRDFYLIFKEVINNIAKYAKATDVVIELNKPDGQLQLIVKDNGIGFQPELANNGNGLRNMQQRTDRQGGHFEVKSLPGNGTTITVNMPYAS